MPREELLIGDKKRRTGMDGGQQIGRRLSFFDGEEEEKKKKNMCMVWKHIREERYASTHA